MKNLNQSQTILKGVCSFYAKLDANSCFMDDLDDRLQPENLTHEVEIITEITQDWYEDGYLTKVEYDWLMEQLGIVAENINGEDE